MLGRRAPASRPHRLEVRRSCRPAAPKAAVGIWPPASAGGLNTHAIKTLYFLVHVRTHIHICIYRHVYMCAHTCMYIYIHAHILFIPIYRSLHSLILLL